MRIKYLVIKWLNEATENDAERAYIGAQHTNIDDARREAIIESLMCDLEVDLAPFGGAAAFTASLTALAPLALDGLVEINGDIIRVPTNMRAFCRLVASAFDAYANAGTQHSKAI